ncbi:MAG: aconitate hydratase AcnA [Desulfobacterales bacterium]|nr:MAG: aconitate hydratase AcnA [Desulfobacterales bacterium]
MDKKDFAQSLQTAGKRYTFYNINLLAEQGFGDIGRLPYTIRILVENLLRKLDDKTVTEDDLRKITTWKTSYSSPVEIPYHPARVLMQDFTGVPAVVDLASLRDAVADLGGDPGIVNPTVPVELVADHSVQVDFSGTKESLTANVAKEYERNSERYSVFKWAQNSFDNFKVVPPNSGICHQVNLEHLGRVTITETPRNGKEESIAYPDTVVGLDSHTTMINGIGVMGWGVGGIEAEAVMLGQPYYMSIPEVIGVHLTGELPAGITATDLVLTLTELLRKTKVVEKFVEFFGPGMSSLSIPDRATIANMTPEFGATLGFFPIDDKTIAYLHNTGRDHEAAVTEAVSKANSLFYNSSEEREYSQVIEFDLSTVQPSIAGPSRPQDRINLSDASSTFADLLGREAKKSIPVEMNGREEKIGDGSIVIAAITSCTNTSNPYVLLGAGLIAKEAVKRGLKVPGFIKTSLAPGSRIVSNYLKESGLLPYLEALGFHITAFGCTTCIGNSGPLHPELEKAITDNDLNVAAVLSGNRNFEARIHQKIQSNFLASPMLVVAYALAGTIAVDLTTEPIGTDPNGQPVYLRELWPENATIEALVQKHVTQSAFLAEYRHIFTGDEFWKKLPSSERTTYNWDENSTYIKKPPYFDNFSIEPAPPERIENARVFLKLGDSITTDHISPAGAIAREYPAGNYLASRGVEPANFNSYGSRRGNHEVMMRGTFGNIRIKNRLVGGKEGAFTIKMPEQKEMFNYDAALQYAEENTPLIVLAGKEYGTGSSRDWAAKGSSLLGVKAVIAESFERIHRNNLVGMGVLPLVFKEGENSETLGLKGDEKYTIEGLAEIAPRKELQVSVQKKNGEQLTFKVIARLDTEVDVTYFRHGGILPYVLRKILQS